MTFYAARFPNAYSTISATINDLATKNSVRLTNLAYTPTPALAGLAEVRMDASLSGEYAPLMHFINGLERSKTFFLINGLTLTGSAGRHGESAFAPDYLSPCRRPEPARAARRRTRTPPEEESR